MSEKSQFQIPIFINMIDSVRWTEIIKIRLNKWTSIPRYLQQRLCLIQLKMGLMIFRSDTADPLQCGSSYDVNTVTVQNRWMNWHLPVTKNRSCTSSYSSSSSSSISNSNYNNNNNTCNKYAYYNYTQAYY